MNPLIATALLDGDKPKKKKVPNPPIPISDEELERFSDWTGSKGSTAVAAQDLLRRGLIGADQIRDAPVDITDAASIKNSQADWKPAAISQILMNARKLNLRKPEEIMANKDVLIGNPRFREAINHPSFGQIHPNFWQIISNSIIPEQYAKSERLNQVATR